MKASLTKVLTAGAAISALILGVAALAWACTAQTRVIALSPQAGPVGSQVVVKGEGVPPNSAVDIRWNGLEGLKLAETTADAAGYFSATVVIPDTASQVNFLMAVGQSGVARVPFETEEAAAAAPRGAADLWSGFSSVRGELDTPGATGDAAGRVPQMAMLATVSGLALAGFSFGMAVGVRRRRTTA